MSVVPPALDHPPPAQPAAPLAVLTQEAGLVDVDAALGDNAGAAGTGVVLNSTGEVLTNNHIITGAIGIKVAVIATAVSYTATVVGRDATTDAAVVQLAQASGLAVAPFGDSDSLQVGDAVIGIGNAGGGGGTPAAAPGTVTGLHQSIVATTDDGSAPEHLTGLIDPNAQIRPEDSGGPLYDDRGRIVGTDTAGGGTEPASSSRSRYRSILRSPLPT